MTSGAFLLGSFMEPYYADDLATLYHGDCREVMAQLPDASVDAVVTDPPYELAFMGRRWDSSGIAFNAAMWAEVLRVLKPGGHILAFGGTRTWHRMAVAIEDAGFDIRDSIAWMYGSGFPKSLDVSKAIDKRGGTTANFTEFRDAVKAAMKRNGVSRATLQEALGNFMLSHYLTAGSQPAVPNLKDYRIIRDTVGLGHAFDDLFADAAERDVIGQSQHKPGIANKTEGHYTVGGTEAKRVDITAPATTAAANWQGWGTALKPAFEPVVVARKPPIGTVAENVLEHGTGALNIDGCRIPSDDGYEKAWDKPVSTSSANVVLGNLVGDGRKFVDLSANKPTGGRWPANVILDEDQAAALDQQSGDRPTSRPGQVVRRKDPTEYVSDSMGAESRPAGSVMVAYGDTGGASRFFYVPKANRRERPTADGIAHPTVKPLALMTYLIRLVTPPGGIVLDPFAGSGTTLEAATVEGFRSIGIELTPEYLPLIEQRLRRNIQPTLDTAS